MEVLRRILISFRRRRPIHVMYTVAGLAAILIVTLMLFEQPPLPQDPHQRPQPPNTTNGSPRIKTPSTTSFLYANTSIEATIKAKTLERFDAFAIALKSGKETFTARTTAQFESFLEPVKNILVVGEANSVSHASGRKMVDVYHGALTAAKERLGPDGTAFAESRKGKLKLVVEDKWKAGPLQPDGGGKGADNTGKAGWFNNEGWVADAHKNMPGFALLYKTFPESSWFLMIDDDSFVFMDQLLRLTAKYNPNKPYYFGQANGFTGCDDVQDMKKGPPVAQGGAGILLSRGALVKMLEIGDQCIVQYNECWAGDVRVGLCLRDAGIPMKHIPGFNGWPPQENFVFSPNPCEPPITYHHVLPSQMRVLHGLERDAATRGIPLTSAHMFHTFLQQSFSSTNDSTISQNRTIKSTSASLLSSASSASTSTHIVDFDTERRGKPFMNFHILSWKDCKWRCEYYTECVSWYFDAKRDWCWLKRTPGGKDEEIGSVSGVMPGRYVCKDGGRRIAR